MAVPITPDMSEDDILQAIKKMGTPPTVANPLETSKGAPYAGYTYGGITQGSGGGYDADASTPSTPATQIPAAQKQPTINYGAPAATPAPVGQMQSLDSILNSQFGGATTPRITSITPNSGGGGYSGGNYGPIMGSITGAFKKANAANEARYNEAKNTLANYGQSYTNDINNNFNQDVAKQEQDATSRGLGNSTIRSSLIGGARTRQQNSLLDLKDRLAAQNVNLLSSKYDNAPNPLDMANLLAQATGSGANPSILRSLRLG